MAAQKTITINGRLYDAVTGLPITTESAPRAPKTSTTPKVASASKVKPAPKPASSATAKAAPKAASKAPARPAASRSTTAATNVHGNVQKSQTLMRRATKKPTAPPKVVRRSAPGRHMDIARSTNVSKFAPHPVVKEPAAPAATTARPAPAIADKPAQVHPTAKRALAKAHTKKQAEIRAAVPATPKEIKEAEIQKAINTPKPKAKKEPRSKWTKRLVIIGSIVAVVTLALFAVYKFVPSISVSVAAAQAGIQARYPEYTPDGYTLSQPVTYSDGEVTLKFHSNSNANVYQINQKRSSWDSSAVLDNVVKPEVGENYTTTKERGLTIYTYNNGAAWVNGGLLYTISGDASLSGDQIRRLATSL